MKSIRFHAHGESDVLKYEDIADPKPQSGEVCVSIQAAALNHLDIWVRKGLPGVKLPLPRIPGSDGAGVIIECGEGVAQIKVGDRVILSPGMAEIDCPPGSDSLSDQYQLLGLQIDGTYCEKVVVPERRVIQVSDRWSIEEWSSVSLVFLTAWRMLHTHGRLKSSDRVLIHAAGSGIGQAAIQIAKSEGAEVFTTVGANEKVKKAKALGADHVICYRDIDFADEIKRLTQDRGVDLIFEHIGLETWKKNVSCLAKGGRMVTCGATSGPQVEIDLRHLFMKQQTIIGSYMGSHIELLKVIELLEQGKLKPVVDKVFPLTEAGKAQDYMDSRKHFGKIVLSI